MTMSKVEQRLFDLEEYLMRNDDRADSSAYLTIVGIANDVSEIEAENAKLRELVKAAYRCTNAGPSCLECRMVAGGCTLLSAMRELGVEVDGWATTLWIR